MSNFEIALNRLDDELHGQNYELYVFLHKIISEAIELQAQVDAIKPIADYANNQADMAQSRLLKQGDLYDDTYWQPVLDTVRFELLQIATIKGEKS